MINVDYTTQLLYTAAYQRNKHNPYYNYPT